MLQRQLLEIVIQRNSYARARISMPGIWTSSGSGIIFEETGYIMSFIVSGVIVNTPPFCLYTLEVHNH